MRVCVEWGGGPPRLQQLLILQPCHCVSAIERQVRVALAHRARQQEMQSQLQHAWLPAKSCEQRRGRRVVGRPLNRNVHTRAHRHNVIHTIMHVHTRPTRSAGWVAVGIDVGEHAAA